MRHRTAIQAGIIAAGPAALQSIAQTLEPTSPTLAMASQCLAVVLGGVVGFAGNRLASRQDAIDNQQPAGAHEVGLNHHLSRLAGQSLKTIVDELANAAPEGSPEQRALQHAAKRTEAAWQVALQAPSSAALRRLDSRRLTDAAASQAVGSTQVLTPEKWLPFAEYVLSESGQDPFPADLAQKLAARFQSEFARHFLEHAKFSAQKDPPAFAALLIQFLSELRFTQRDHSQEFAALKLELGKVSQSIAVLATATVTTPAFDWDKLTTHLAESEQAHAEAREFYRSQGKNWDELLPLARDTWTLVRDIQGVQHQALLQQIAGLNLLVKDQVVATLRDLQRGVGDPVSQASIIVELIRSQREQDAESRRQFQNFLQQRDNLRGQGGHHYYQPERWSPGHRTRKLWREAGTVFVPRPPLLNHDDVPPPGTNYYLYGESGHGKSILAANIADRLMARGYRALTFNLRQAGDILRHLALLTDHEWLGLNPPDKTATAWASDTDKIVAACTWLLEQGRPDDLNHPPFCLVWDNADDMVTLDHLFQLQLLHHRGVQIITTRIPPTAISFPADHPCHNWPPRLLTIQPVGPYTTDEGSQHLVQTTETGRQNGMGGPAPDDYERILQAVRLDGDADRIDPLKLHDLLSALQKQSWRIDAVLRPEPVPTTTTSAPVPPDQTHAEFLTQLLATLSPLTQVVWRVLVHLAPAPIPEEFWSAMDAIFQETDELPELDRAAIATERRGRLPLIQVRSTLAQVGLLTGGDEGDLVHTRHLTLGRELTPPELRPAIARQVIRLLRAAAPAGNPHDNLKTWPFYRTAEPHLLAAFGPDRTADILDLRETDWLTNRFNSYLIQQLRLVEAMAIAQVNLASNIVVNGAGSMNHAASLHELARVNLALERFADAEQGFLNALKIKKQHLGESHPATAITTHELARTYLDQGRYADAEREFLQAIEVKKQHWGESHLTTAITIHELARNYLDQGRYADAERAFLQALEIKKQHRGESHPNTAITIHELARTYLEQGRYADAERGFLKALEIKKQHRGESHLATATTVHSLARTYLEQGRYAEAASGFLLALEIKKQHRGESHSSTATTIHALASTYLEQGRYADAEREFLRAMKIYLQHSGNGSWRVAVTRSNLARVMWETERRGESAELFVQAQTALEATLGERHRRVGDVLHCWGECELEFIPSIDLSPLAETLVARVRQALEIRHAALPAGHPDTAKTRVLLAECLRRRGSLDQARVEATAAAEVLKQALPKTHRANQQAQALLKLLKPKTPRKRRPPKQP